MGKEQTIHYNPRYTLGNDRRVLMAKKKYNLFGSYSRSFEEETRVRSSKQTEETRM